MTASQNHGLVALHRLARLYGLMPTYLDLNKARAAVTPEVLITILRARGAPLGDGLDFQTAATERLRGHWRWSLSPVYLFWDGKPRDIELRLPAPEASGRVDLELELEAGERRRWSERLEEAPSTREREIGGDRFVAKRLSLPLTETPLGYHRLRATVGGRELASLIIAAPERAYQHPGQPWGPLLPLYALRTANDWGSGNFSDLARLAGWAAGKGAGIVGTLPLLACFFDHFYEPSPYRPMSRLFWNELFVDVERVVREAACPAAADLLASPAVRDEVARLRSAPLVPYRDAMALKRRILQALSACLSDASPEHIDDFERFRVQRPEVDDYARFRSALERRRQSWREWPESARRGRLGPEDYDEETVQYYAYAQWLAETEMEAAATSAQAAGVDFYLDLPLGVHPDGYDAWRYQDLFLSGVSTGAPPDIVTTSGQNWGFAPLDPDRTRQRGYDYVIAYMRHQMRASGILRIDHVMGLHRLYWIPDGAGARDGAYVRYPAEELYAILCLESHRHRTAIVGEDLGLVPDSVAAAMKEHNISGMFVLSVYLRDDPEQPFRPIPPRSVASLGTHDLPPFAAFWQGLDLSERVRLGVLTEERATAERQDRERQKRLLLAYLVRHGFLAAGAVADLMAVLKACMGMLASGPAERLLLNLEDVWLETESQNVPGTSNETPNWQRRARYRLEELDSAPGLVELLAELDRRRSVQ